MKSKRLAAAVVAALITAGAMAEQTGKMPPIAEDEPIYGSQMMTQQERLQYRERLRNASTLEERERIRSQHHEQMQTRARERGVSLPDTPPAKGGKQHGSPGAGAGGGGKGGGGSGSGGGGNR